MNETQGETTENTNWAARVDESEENKKEEEDKEEHPNFMTLDEYKSLKNQITTKNNEFNIRKPGEGEDLSKWGKTYVLPKKKDEDEDEEEEEEVEEEEENEEETEEDKKKSLLNQIQIRFYESASSTRGDRRGGGRGGPRRSGPRPQTGDAPAPAASSDAPAGTPTSPAQQVENRNRGPRQGGNQRRGGPSRGQAQKAPRIEDEKDFPSLGKA